MDVDVYHKMRSDLNRILTHQYVIQYTSEALPQTDEFVCIYQIYCLKHRDAGCWMLDAGRRSRLQQG
jgi:hypothetical protein